MKKEYGRNVYLLRQKVFAEMKISHQLDGFVRQIRMNGNQSLCGVLVSGYTGTGKTFFIENYLQKLEDTHPVLIARHHQQHQNIPYFGFKYCISDYLSKIYNESSKTELHNFSDSLKEYLGDSFLLLTDYIPELSLISGKESLFPQRSLLTIENQLYPLFKKLFEFLVDYYKQPVFLFTDDLQWIDASGINLLKYLLLNLPAEKLIWVGACRAPQNKISLLGQLAEELHFKKIRFENILIKGLNRNEVQLFLEMTLSGECSKELIDTCCTLTDGNPSHLQALLESLKNTDLIWLVGSTWHCDAEAINIQYTGRNAERMLLESVKKLSTPAYKVLCMMACMGRFNRPIILDWLQGDKLLMKVLLNEAREAGLLEPDENEVRFSEMHIGEMIYNDLSNSHKLEFHYKIANLFYLRGLDRLSTTEIILMATSFNHSLDRVKADGKLQVAATLNYNAGKILHQDKAFDQARYFLKMSAELLKECPWEQVCEQVWLVYMDRARIEYYLGEYDLAEIHLDYLLERTTDSLKRAKVFELKVTINNHLGRYRKVVLILKEILSQLGLELPLDQDLLQSELEKLKYLLAKQEENQQELLQHASLNTDYNEAILKLLYVGGMGLHHTSDVLMTWAALQIVLRSGTDKISVVKAIGYVSYGRMLIISGDIEKGFEFGTKGLKFNQSTNDITLRCRVFGVYAFYIQPWKKAFSESKIFLEEAADAGIKAEDFIGLYILKTHQLNLHVISGLPLKDLVQLNFEESHPGTELTYYITHYQKSLLKFLTGESAVFSIPRQQPSSLAAQLTIQEEKFYRNYVWARYYFLFGHYELAAKAADEAHDNRKLQEGSPLLPANLMIWFLSVTQNWGNYSTDTCKALEIKINDVLKSFNTWRNHAPSNYEPGWLLLNAEWSRLQGNDLEASQYFQKSLDESGSNIYHYAITHELWAKYLLTVQGAESSARNHFLSAINCFNIWGAIAKAKQLKQQFEAILSRDRAFTLEMDIETIQYELSGDMEVASLVKKLMVLLLRISGSSHVVVELVEDNGDRIWYDELPLLYGLSEKPTSIPVSMILMALKSQNTVVVNDLKSEKGMRDFDAIHNRGVQSFLILPVTISGHLSMVIYLENIYAKNWYVQERVKWVRITANQGAVIIENARIHERSIKLNEDIRTEMKEKERLSSVIEAQKDAHLKALVQTQDNERKRIASDLHDSLGSLLSSVRLRFNGLQEDFTVRVPEKSSRFNDSLKLLDEAIHELRQISHNMVPVSLGRFGLQSALQTFVGQVNASEQLDVDLQILGLERRLSEEIEVSVYRICQELVQNVIKHSNASTLRIQIIHHKDSLNIIVEDNGKGMKKEDISPGFGFNTIQSKVNLFKGTFGIESQLGKGTMILVDLPVPE
jgi:signal transduction histidine kinase/predicted ATPase